MILNYELRPSSSLGMTLITDYELRITNYGFEVLPNTKLANQKII